VGQGLKPKRQEPGGNVILFRVTETTALWLTGIVSAVAIIAAPMIALAVQRRLDQEKEARVRKQQIFQALWTNRRRPFWIARVDALNLIDVEFFGISTVQDAWQDLRAHYFQQEFPGLNQQQIDREREEKFATLLYQISEVLGYKFSRTDIRDNIYRPQLHTTADEIEFETRSRVLALLKSDALPVRFVTPETSIAGPNAPETSAAIPAPRVTAD
jgi:hypothetical protein